MSVLRFFDVTTKLISRTFGALADIPLPAFLRVPVIRSFSRIIQADHTEVAGDYGDFQSCGDYFARALKAGSRPVSSAPVVSPADGVVREWCSVRELVQAEAPSAIAAGAGKSRELAIKGSLYSLPALLGWELPASKMSSVHKSRAYISAEVHGAAMQDFVPHGEVAVVYLAPHNYHRVHAPVEGTIDSIRLIRGPLWPVNDWGIKHIADLFCVNERLVFEGHCALGRWALVMVGATNVGRMTISCLPESERARLLSSPSKSLPGYELRGAWPISKGAELGCFRLGSTVVLVTSFGMAHRPDSIKEKPFEIRCGNGFGR